MILLPFLMPSSYKKLLYMSVIYLMNVNHFGLDSFILDKILLCISVMTGFYIVLHNKN